MNSSKRALHSMNRRDFLTGAAASLALGRTSMGASPAKPNVIFILADDLGRSDVGCYGQKKIKTPNIDRLAAEGMRFTQAYAGGAVCAPSRCTLMTGLHTGHSTIRHNFSISRNKERVSLRAEDVTVAQVMKSAGYATGIFGKWGLAEPDTGGVPTRHGFDEWLGYLNNDHATEYYTDFLWRGEHKEIIKENLNDARRVYTHDLFTREAIGFIRKHLRDPFFLYLPYTIPHGERVVPSDAPYTKENWTQEQKNYAAMTTRMDSDIGRIVALLKESGLDSNTIVFFASDNGAGFNAEGVALFGSTGPLRDKKGTVYEGGIRVPMIARWPGKIKPGSVSEQLFTFWDFLPTAAELVGANTPAKIDGISILSALLSNKLKDQERPLYWEAHGNGFQQAVRMGNWKGVRPALKQPLELYDLSRDIGESKNLASAQPAIVARMEAFLRDARTEAPEYPPKPSSKGSGQPR